MTYTNCRETEKKDMLHDAAVLEQTNTGHSHSFWLFVVMKCLDVTLNAEM